VRCAIPILLTATVRPHNSRELFEVRQTEQQRFEQYRSALTYLANSRLFSRIVFAENSLSSWVPEIKALARSLENKKLRIEVFHAPIDDESAVQGKGYGEGSLISRAVEESETLRSHESFIKLTGRYKLRNLYRLLPPIQDAAASDHAPEFICQGLRRYRGTVPIVSTVFFWCKTSVWKTFFLDAYQAVHDKDGWAFEAEVAKRLQTMVMTGHRVWEVPLPLVVDARNTKDNLLMLSRWELCRATAQSLGGYVLRRSRTLRNVMSEEF
jgi:hypothetical protein